MSEDFKRISPRRRERRSGNEGILAGRPDSGAGRSPWDERLAQLLDFKAVHGHCNVPRGWRENPSLSYWVINQRYELRKGTLSPGKARRLAENGVAWTSAAQRSELRAQAWLRMYRKLSALKNPSAPADGDVKQPTRKLKRWLTNQRYLMRIGLLPEDRRLKLESLGMLWNLDRGRSSARDAAWEQMYRKARKIQEEKRGRPRDERTAVPFKLARWLAYQRHRLRGNRLPEDRRRRLLELGLGESSEPLGSTAWRRMYLLLEEFHAVHGDCSVPRTFPEYPALGRWVYRQRNLHRSARLPEERKILLDKLGFDWSRESMQDRKRSERWTRMFLRLLTYRAIHGHTRVPRRNRSHQTLADWVARQRQRKKCGRLSDEQTAKLSGIGFHWDGRH